ncbi:MAG TPA: LacI family DNA-binding transcriptional regulator [Arthrobacter sp.]|nr:LacI family DNA-binding transcriptional regulator [Arthrobacter sp.]
MSPKHTLVTLANELGVSRQTVSNAINSPHRVKPETLERVRAAIAEAGYRPSAAGRQLRTRRSMDLAMRLYPSTDGINGSILDRFLHSLTESAQVEGYRLTLFTADDDADEIAEYEQLLDTADLDGFVLTNTHHADARTDWLLEREVPFVAFGRPWSATSDPFDAAHAWVDIDGGAGTAAATEMFLARGHRKVAFLGWPEGSGAGDDRRSGWRRAMAAGAAGSDFAALNVSVEDNVRNGARGAETLVAQGATAIVCASDSLALGAAAAWRQLLPDAGEPAVVGFDDTPVAAAVGLSSVSQPIEAAAQHTVSLLTHQLTGPSGQTEPEQHLLLKSELVQRRSDPFITTGEPVS